MTLSDLTTQLSHYSTTRDTGSYEAITHALCHSAIADADYPRTLQCMAQAASVEALWAALIGTQLWQQGQRSTTDFNNLWACTRFAGISSRFSPLSAADHLARASAWAVDAAHPAPLTQPALAPLKRLAMGNALRHLHRYAEAESCYLQGTAAFPDYPFFKFRLVDLYLMTYRLDAARQLLASLRARYPYALEHMFALPVPESALGPQDVLPSLSAGDADFVWLVACDPVYAQRYGQTFAQTVAAKTAGKAHVHFHVVRDVETPAPTEVIEQIKTHVPLCSTERTVTLGGANANQRKALFASERFLFLAELLQKYQKPLLVSDIDVECLQNPFPLFAQLAQFGDADVGLTRFGVIREAWDQYPATAIVVQPTAHAVAFFQRLAGMVIHLLNTHPQPWFVDQVALYRLIEEGLTPAKVGYLEQLLSDGHAPNAYLRILHGSWQEGAQ